MLKFYIYRCITNIYISIHIQIYNSLCVIFCVNAHIPESPRAAKRRLRGRNAINRGLKQKPRARNVAAATAAAAAAPRATARRKVSTW